MPFGFGRRRRADYASSAPGTTTTTTTSVSSSSSVPSVPAGSFTGSNSIHGSPPGTRAGGFMSRFRDRGYRDDRESGRRGFGGRTYGAYPDSLSSRPSFGQWLKGTFLDILTMAALGAVGLGVYFAAPAPSRSFPVIFQNGEIVYPQFAYPLRKEIIPIWAAAILAVFVPIVIFLFCQIRVRSFWDVNNAVLGLLYSLITAAVFQVFLKWLIGGLRPHFLAVCRPNPALVGFRGNGFGSIMFQRNICTGDRDQINDSLKSFPSGHTTAAFAGFVYLYLYLNAKLKVFSNYHPALWKLAAIYAPILGATLIGGALTIDEFHNWYDIVAGAVIGTVFAFSAYRMMYASVWDFRFNHVPLSRDQPFSYGAGGDFGGFHGFHETVFTRKAGWGTEECFAMGGAPFDAAGLGMGRAGGRSGTGRRDNGGVARGVVVVKDESVRSGQIV